MARRLALIIGNAAYAHATELANPRNDATAIVGVLKELDFDVALGVDLARDQMEDILLRFEGIFPMPTRRYSFLPVTAFK